MGPGLAVNMVSGFEHLCLESELSRRVILYIEVQ
jgi:hypothetical protein